MNMNVLKNIWAFKIKRFPNELIMKFKGRFCYRGDMQIEGVDFETTGVGLSSAPLFITKNEHPETKNEIKT